MRPFANRPPTVLRLVPLMLAACVLLPIHRADAIPAFARKYGTSCTTCHTIYPKLNPFGEAFRRNGYRFPGDDSEMIKEEALPLGQPAYKKVFPNAVWPATIAGSLPLAFGVNGQIDLHPKTSSGAADAADNAAVDVTHLVDEAHLWSGGTIGDTISFFGELTANGEDPIEIEHAVVQFDDLFGPAHAFNIAIGKSKAALSSFGMRSSYVTDMPIPATNEAALAGVDGDGWAMMDDFNSLELNGTTCGRFDYAVGINQGASDVVRVPRNVYAHVGYKFGGVRLDGEDGSAVADPMKPWAENAITLDAFAQLASTKYGDVVDQAKVFGGSLRAQAQSLELDAGAYYETHDNGGATGSKGTVLRQWDELSYVVHPWLVPAVRLEYIKFKPETGASASDLAVTASVDALIRANLKATLSARMEHSSAPPAAGGWGDVASADRNVSFEVEGLTLGMAYAY